MNAHLDHYLNEIEGDFIYYGEVFKSIGVKNRVFINNNKPEEVVDSIIKKYHLKSKNK